MKYNKKIRIKHVTGIAHLFLMEHFRGRKDGKNGQLKTAEDGSLTTPYIQTRWCCFTKYQYTEYQACISILAPFREESKRLISQLALQPYDLCNNPPKCPQDIRRQHQIAEKQVNILSRLAEIMEIIHSQETLRENQCHSAYYIVRSHTQAYWSGLLATIDDSGPTYIKPYFPDENENPALKLYKENFSKDNKLIESILSNGGI